MSETVFDAVGEALREQLTDLLRRTRPRVIFCYIAGDKRKMDTGGGRGVRYSQLARVIVAMGPTLERVDLCNAKGELIESWHPRGAIVEDEQDDPATPAIELPAGLATLPAEVVGQVLTLCLSFNNQAVAALQRMNDHTMDRFTASQRVLVGSLVDILKHERQRADAAERDAERDRQRTHRERERALLSQLESREVALDAKRIAEEGEPDPNSPDGMMTAYLRTLVDRHLAPPGAAGAQSPGRTYTTQKDVDEN